jgi:hypothetical protein
LTEAIQEYRRQLSPQHVTDEKIVDFDLGIRGTTEERALPKGHVSYR